MRQAARLGRNRQPLDQVGQVQQIARGNFDRFRGRIDSDHRVTAAESSPSRVESKNTTYVIARVVRLDSTPSTHARPSCCGSG